MEGRVGYAGLLSENMLQHRTYLILEQDERDEMQHPPPVVLLPVHT